MGAAPYSALQWRNIGPIRAGRAITVSGVPGTNTFYFGAVGGGIWKTEDAGVTWTPVSDALDVASIGAIAVAPSDPNVIYAGSGEADMRSDIQQGDGMYKSVDAGRTWRHIGLEATAQIGRVVVDPKDANVVYVAALGRPYGPNSERGVFKSVDGGATWSKVLYHDENTGAIDLAIDPSDPSVIYASLWQTRRPPWNTYPPSNGPGGGLYKSSDAGKTWTHITGHGFPGGIVGHIGLSISPANPQRVYAQVDTNVAKTGGVYRTDDGGATWRYMSGDARIWNRGWYFGQITADPKDPDTVYVMNTSFYRSTDGGATFTTVKGEPGGDDYHTLWIDPSNAERMVLGGDQGVVVSVNRGATWSSWYTQSTGQIYHVITDNRFPYWVYGAQQDSGAVAIPSRSIHRNISMLDWKPIDAGGESGTIAPDPLHPGHLFANPPVEENIDTNWELHIDPTLKYTGTVWRDAWTLPIAISPQNPHVLYTSRQQIFRSGDSGKTWSIVSPDLTQPHNTVPPNLDPPTVADNTGLAHRGVVYWIAPSPVRAHQIWAGTSDGLIWLTRDEGARWRNVSIPGLGPWSKIGIIDASHFDAQTAYAAVDRHRVDDNRPYIYKTHDGGAHWTAIASGLPANAWINVVREDPKRKGLLYAGSERRVYVSLNDGASWQPLQLNMPAASIRDIVFNGDDVIAGTHGRGIYILDNASPLRQTTAAVGRSGAYLFAPATAYRLRDGDDQGTPLPPEEYAMQNPYTGAAIDYFLGSDQTVHLQILDSAGHVVREWSSTDPAIVPNPKQSTYTPMWLTAIYPPSGKAGAHRFIWDLHYANRGPLATPGRYTVRMTADAHTAWQTLVLRRDPTAPATDADLRAQFQLASAVQQELTNVRAAAKRAPARSFTETPDQGGTTAQDTNSLRAVAAGLGALYEAIESADARPTQDMYEAFARLRAKASRLVR